MKRIFYVLSILVLVICAVFIVTKVREKGKDRQAFQSLDQVIPVTAVPASMELFQDKISAVGTLMARQENLLSPKVAGNIDAVLVDIGEKVKAGQPVIKLDKTTFRLAVKQAESAFSAAFASVAQVKSQLGQAKKEYNRAKNLLAENVIPQNRFDAAETGYTTAREALLFAKGKHNQAKAALETAREYLKYTEIHSSIDGVVVQRTAEIGQAVAPGVQVLRILDQAMVKADIELPEKDFGRIGFKTTAVMMVAAFPGMEFNSEVTVINPMVDPGIRTFKVRIETSNQTGKLVDGMFVKVNFLLDQKEALAIPRAALQKLPGSGTYYVFAVKNNKAFKKEVKIGTMTDGFAEVIDGLARGELVITNGAGKLRSGVNVKVSNKAVKTLKEG